MHCHLLPLSKNYKDKLTIKLQAIWLKWLEEWVSPQIQLNQFEFNCQPCDNKLWSSLNQAASVNWFSAGSEHSNLFALSYGFDFSSWVTHHMTGCAESDFNGGIVDINQIVNETMHEFSQSFYEGCKKAEDYQQAIDEIEQTINKNRKDFSGVVVEISNDSFTFRLYLSNQLAKNWLRQGEQRKNNDKLISRKSAICHKSLAVSAHIEGLVINLEDLNTLQVGDILTNRKPISEQIAVLVNKEKMNVAHVRLGQKSGQRAIKFLK